MTDPKENTDSKNQENENESSAEDSNKTESTNPQWDEHMQIDEEGNEVAPEDQ